jgi:transcriptional regulator with XRE-family HTH domain
MSHRRQPLPPSEELRARLGINLRECRRRLGISQYEVSFRAETHMNAISALELGKRLPRIDTFIRLAGALEATPSELTAGILWTPAEQVVVPGGFEAPEDAELAAEVAALRKAARRGRRADG